MIFSGEQESAIDLDRFGQDACIVAGPGSGKTAVLVERYTRLVSRLTPAQILAITFTEKAAASMKKRIRENFESQNLSTAALDDAPIHTIDAFCARLVRENAVLAGVDPEFTVLDERIGSIERASCAAQALNELLVERRPEMLELARGRPEADLACVMVDVYENIRSSGASVGSLSEVDEAEDTAWHRILTLLDEFERESRAARSPAQRLQRDQVLEFVERMRAVSPAQQPAEAMRVLARRGYKQQALISSRCQEILREVKELVEEAQAVLMTRWSRPYRALLCDSLVRFEQIYAARKRELGVLDFADLITHAVRLLEEFPRVRERISQQYEQVLIDEFQDTNPVQEKFLKLLRNAGNFYAVGDVNQSIFGFRHAVPEVFLSHREQVKQRGQHHCELTDNWRSRTDILRAAERITAGQQGVEERRLLARRELPPRAEPCVEVLIAESEENAQELEAQLVAARILELHSTLRLGPESRPARFQDFAILLRTADRHMPRFAAALERAAIPHLLTRRANFFEEREITDLFCVLEMIANPRDEIATAAVLRSPLVSVSDETLLALHQGGSLAAGLAALPANLDSEDHRRLLRFRQQLAAWRLVQPGIAADRLLLRVLDDCGQVLNPRTRAGANIEKLLSILRAYSSNLPLRELCDHLRRMQETNAREMDAPVDDDFDGVRLLTAHASKGLEFPVVMIPSMERGSDSNTPTITFHQELGLGASWNSPAGGKEACPDDIGRRTAEILSQRDKDESRRLLYVALTRAEEHLLLSWSGTGRSGTGKRPLEWAGIVSDALGCDQLVAGAPPKIWECQNPAGESFQVRGERATQPPNAWTDYSARGTAAPEFLARPSLTGQYDAIASVTALTQFAACPRKYYLARYLDIENPARRLKIHLLEEDDELPEPRLDAGELGTQVHDLLAGLPVVNADSHAVIMADRFKKSDLGRRAARALRAEREFAFLLEIDDVIVGGTIDLWFAEGDDLILVDYKTDDVTAAEAEIRAAEYALQVRLYALALEHWEGRLPAAAYLHFLRPDVVIEIALGADPMAVADAAVRRLRDAQERCDFPLHEGAHCRRCQFYRGACPAGTAQLPVLI